MQNQRFNPASTAPGNVGPYGVPRPGLVHAGRQSSSGEADPGHMSQPGTIQHPSSSSYYSNAQARPQVRPGYPPAQPMRPSMAPVNHQPGFQQQPTSNSVPAPPQTSSSLHGQMGNLSLQNVPGSNGRMHQPQAPLRSEMHSTSSTPGMHSTGVRPPYVPPRPPHSGEPAIGAPPQPPPQDHHSATQTGPPSPSQFSRPYASSSQKPIRPGTMRPTPATMSSRPMPGPYPPQNGIPNPSKSSQSLAPPGFPQTQPQQPPQLSMSMVPRPMHTSCGKPRQYYHRGMALSTGDRSIMTIPNSNSDFISVDDGSARIRFVRLTTNAIASEPNVMAKTGVPVALVMTPFANTVPGETPVPVVDFSGKQVLGPLRCERCNGYANPGFKFINGGAEFQCNLCTHMNKTPSEHYSPISSSGARMDADTRPEMHVGSVDYILSSPDYWIRPPKPACYFFAVDVSANAVSSGLSSAALMSIKSAIGAGLLPGTNEGARIAFMTFDRALYFFDARGSETGKSVTVQVVPDILDPFVPLGGEGLFLLPEQAVHAIDSALDFHGLNPASANPEKSPPPVECTLGSSLQAIKLAFKDCGGKAFVVAGSLPTAGLLKLERRGGGAMGGSEEREMALLKEANPSYDILGCEFSEIQASVDLFLAPSSYIDASTLSRLPRACGGLMHLFPEFDVIRDGASLHRSLCTAASEVRALEALLRVRTSPGLEAKGEYVGHFGRPQRGDDVCGPVFDASSTLALEVAVTAKLFDGGRNEINGPYSGGSYYDDACFQAAILYTDCGGRRRIRVHTVFAKKTTVLSDVFLHGDADATAAFLCKKVASAVLVGGTTFAKAWDALTEKTSQMFYVYRKHCTSSPVEGQLILPESYKVLPVMMLGIIKSAALRRTAGSVHSGEAVTVDERAAALSFLISGTIAETAVMCYPRMWEVQQLDELAGIPLPPPQDPAVEGSLNNEVSRDFTNELISIPNSLPLSAESLRDDRIILLENGMQIVVWVGANVEASVSRNVIATGLGERVLIRGETANSLELLKDVDDYGERLGRVIQRIVSERKGLSRPQVIERNKPGTGADVRWMVPMLIEDRGSTGTHSYVEYLRTIHKRVMEKMMKDSAQSDLQTWEMLNHGY